MYQSDANYASPLVLLAAWLPSLLATSHLGLPRKAPMKNYLLTGTIAIVGCFSIMGLAQEGAKPVKPTPAAEQKADAGKKGRLPANYGKLGLTDPQKAKIYGIQGVYEDQLDELEKQIEAVKAKRDLEVEAVLSEDQRKILKNLVDAAKEAKDAKPAAPAKTDKK